MSREDLHVHYSASLYDHYSKHGVGVFDNWSLARLLREMRTRPAGGRLLDAGTGTGVVPLKLWERPEAIGWEIVGNDFYADMIALANENLARHPRAVAPSGSPGLRFEEGDVHAMAYADGYFDIVLSRSNVHHWRSPVEAFREIHRVLGAGGVAVIHEPRRDSNPEALEEFNRMRAASGVEPSRTDEKYTTEEIQHFLADAGLAAHSRIIAPARGLASLGLEILIYKEPIQAASAQPRAA